MKITDGKKTVKIRMCIFDEFAGLSPDWSTDFFDAGLLPYDEKTDTYTVKDVDYCIKQAKEWHIESEKNLLFIE